MVNIKVICELVEKHKSATAAVAAVEKEIADLFATSRRAPRPAPRTPGPSAFRQNQILALLVSPQSGPKLVAMSGASKYAVRSAIRDLRDKKRIKFDAAIGKYRHA